MDDVRELLNLTASVAADYLESIETRPVFPRLTAQELRAALGGPHNRQNITRPTR